MGGKLTEADKEVMSQINGTPRLLSLLWDMDLMPEQLEVGGAGWKRMLEVVKK